MLLPTQYHPLECYRKQLDTGKRIIFQTQRSHTDTQFLIFFSIFAKSYVFFFWNTAGDVHVKKVDRAGFLSEVQGEHKLAHVETVDKSVPATEGASVGQSKLPALLQEIKAAK